MTTDRDGYFAELEPPPGGADRFRRRLEEEAHAPRALRWRNAAWVGAASAAVALVAAVVLLRDASDGASSPERTAAIYDAPEFDRLLGRPPQPTELMVMRNDQAATVAEIETANEKVRIYLVN